MTCSWIRIQKLAEKSGGVTHPYLFQGLPSPLLGLRPGFPVECAVVEDPLPNLRWISVVTPARSSGLPVALFRPRPLSTSFSRDVGLGYPTENSNIRPVRPLRGRGLRAISRWQYKQRLTSSANGKPPRSEDAGDRRIYLISF